MPVKEVNVSDVYKNDPELKVDDVKSLQDWASRQPHLPEITELQVVLFLQSCYYSNELAKTTIDNYFTVKTLCPDIFGNRNPSDAQVQIAMNTACVSILPKLTPDGYTVVLFRMMDYNPDNYNFALQCRLFDMTALLHLHLNGPSKGIIILGDMKGTAFGHLMKLNVMVMKKFMFYLQEAMPIRLKSLQFINIVSFMDKILAIMKPFMKKELMDSLVLHNELNTLFKYVPKDLLPQDYGGSGESLQVLHEKFKAQMNDNVDLFKFQDSQLVDESKRPGKPKNAGDFFGVEGTFKKLEVD